LIGFRSGPVPPHRLSGGLFLDPGPFRPVALGFTLDTLFYASVFAVLFIAPSRLRRSLRARRGRCTHCGYDLTGNTTGLCPECGPTIAPEPHAACPLVLCHWPLAIWPLAILMLPLLILSSALSGSIPFGLLIARARGIDIRKHGSGNIGATNVW